MSFVDTLTKFGERFEPETDTDTETPPTATNYNDTDTTVYELFQNERRQLAVKLVDDHHDITTRELARQIAAIEDGIDPSEVGHDRYKTVYVQLYQTHLGKLDTAGIVDYDDQAQHVTATEQTENAHALLAYIESTEVTASE